MFFLLNHQWPHPSPASLGCWERSSNRWPSVAQAMQSAYMWDSYVLKRLRGLSPYYDLDLPVAMSTIKSDYINYIILLIMTIYTYNLQPWSTLINHVFLSTTVKSLALHNKKSSKSARTPSQNFRHQPIVDIGKLTATGYRQSSHPQTQNVTKLPGSHVMSHPITAMLRNACLLKTVPLLPAASVAWRHA